MAEICIFLAVPPTLNTFTPFQKANQEKQLFHLEGPNR